MKNKDKALHDAIRKLKALNKAWAETPADQVTPKKYKATTQQMEQLRNKITSLINKKQHAKIHH